MFAQRRDLFGEVVLDADPLSLRAIHPLPVLLPLGLDFLGQSLFQVPQVLAPFLDEPLLLVLEVPLGVERRPVTLEPFVLHFFAQLPVLPGPILHFLPQRGLPRLGLAEQLPRVFQFGFGLNELLLEPLCQPLGVITALLEPLYRIHLPLRFEFLQAGVLAAQHLQFLHQLRIQLAHSNADRGTSGFSSIRLQPFLQIARLRLLRAS
mmetsp:Transcript_13647/g.29580  ORF Transcript_13647/g.29580 Transcript_13647/m.29580 type:complete len:207 (+) Transcript_13647:1158-1778(+)